MFKFLTSWFAKSVDSIIADIVQKVEHLHIVAEAHAAEQKVQQAIINEAVKARIFAEKEYSRAKAIAERLTALVNG